MVVGLKSLDISPRQHRPKRDEFRNPEAMEFRDPEVGFFLYGDAAAFVGNNRPAASDGKNRVGRGLTDYGTFHVDAGLEDQDCNLFWLIGSFVNLLSRQKGRIFGSDPACSVYRSTNSFERHRSAPGASMPTLGRGCQHRRP
ncbi:hypothetical protein [Rhizobium ruizarguesonis]|uniref:hypothetical protein n=1 Tax=Rhizobium ruizarguesonis TaxID=2081791 RepID=UPI0013B5D19E|nr:hypothetical protein [Rhizobium ruizarguesonis]NEI04586.1 hypothetical protein [Rhizobium ruizarguesonis]NEI27381.1 hypothetical protein [Rhizobium ruizarguesonis]